jgi:hypothetical protein
MITLRHWHWITTLMASVFLVLACDLSAVTDTGVSTRVAQSVSATQTIEAEVQRRVQSTLAAQITNTPIILTATRPPATLTPIPTAVPPTSAPNTIVPPTATRVPPTAPSSEPLQTRRLNTGTAVKRGAGWNAGVESYFAIKNSQPLDAVVVLAQGNAVGLAVYIRANESFKIENIYVGSYDFYYVFGEDWDSANAKFTRNTEYHRFNGDLKFERILGGGGSYTYTYWTVTLPAGNSDPDVPVIDETKFISLK